MPFDVYSRAGADAAFATAAQGELADTATQPGDLATVATTGAYADLTGKPTLGTAAATAATDYATAAQGALADSASQPGHAHAGADITSGTVAYARLPVGTAASTLAAGDDSRITGAAQKSANLSDLASASTARTNLGLTDSAVVGALPIPDPGSFYPTDTLTAALQLIGERERYGTGSPEGVVTAPVGTYYTDTDLTNGALRWAKKTGTGNTGWKVTVGDTGWRSISVLIGNGWTGQAWVRRVGDVVDLRVETLNAAAATAGVYLALPAGFRTTGGLFVRSIFYTAAMTLRRVSTYADSTVVGYVAGDVLYGSLAASTAEPWPTTLPGTGV